MSRWLSLALLVAVIIGVAAVFVRVMAGFLIPLFLATLLVVMFRPLHHWMLKKLPRRERLAALLTTVAIALIVLVPLGAIGTLAGMEASSLVVRLNDEDIRQRLTQLRTKLGLTYIYAEEIRYLESSLNSMRVESLQGATAKGDCDAILRMAAAADRLEIKHALGEGPTPELEDLQSAIARLKEFCEHPQDIGTLEYQSHLRAAIAELHAFKVRLAGSESRAWLQDFLNPTSQEIQSITSHVFAGAPGVLRSVGGATTGFLAKAALNLGILLLSVYFFLADGPKMMATLMRLSPLEDRHELELVEEFDRIARAVVIATLLSAVVQGVLAGIGFWFAGVGSIFLLIMLTILFALIPFVGAATVWVPVCLWLYFYDGRPLAAIVLAVYGICIVSMADNVIKPLVLHGQSNLHPLLALLSVLGGVSVLGPIGILVGPMVVVFLQTLLNILHNELSSMDERPTDDATVVAAG